MGVDRRALKGKPMKRLALVLMAGLLVGQVVVPSVAAAAPSPFTGAWTSVDLDGSDQTLAISGGAVVRLQYTDFGAPNTCEGGQGEMFVGTLTGTVADDTLFAAISRAHCGSKAFPDLEGLEFDFVYDGATDTLFGMDVTWHRR
jgi:hypothetical protein